MMGIRRRGVSLRVLFQMATVGAYTGLVKVAGAAKVVFTARAFGMSDGLDAYLIAFLLPSFFADILAGSLNSALVPTFIQVRELEGTAAAHRLYRTVLAAGAGILTAAALVLAALAPWILRVLASSFDPEKFALTCSLFWVMLPLVPITAFIVTWRSMLNTDGHFAIPAILPVFTPFTSILFLLRFGHTWGVYSLAVGTLVGASLEVTVLGLYVARHGFPVIPRWFGRTWALDQVAAQYAPVIGGVLLLGGAPLIDQGIAGMLGSGGVAALNFGTRFSTVLVAVGPSAVATAILPHFSKLTASNDWTHLRQSLRSYAALIVGVTLPAIAVLWIYSPTLVRLFFERGQFTGSDTPLVTQVQRFSLLAIAPSMVMALVLRLISSMKANRLILRASAICASLNLLLDLLLTRWMGIAGIPLATAFVQICGVTYLWFRLHRALDDQADKASIRTSGRPDSPRPEEPLETR